MLVPKLVIWVFPAPDPCHTLPISEYSMCLPLPTHSQASLDSEEKGTSYLEVIPRSQASHASVASLSWQGSLILLFIFNL